jgi:hypothetical protein
MPKFNQPHWNLPPQAYLVIGAVLLLAVAPMPYGYYTLVKILVCGFSAVLAYQNYKTANDSLSAWVWCFLIIAIAFNPLIPLHMQKEVWMVVDAVTGALFLWLTYETRQSRGKP